MMSACRKEWGRARSALRGSTHDAAAEREARAGANRATMMRTQIAVVLFVVAVGACKSDRDAPDWASGGQAAGTGYDDPPPPEPEEDGDESGGTGTAMALEEGKMGKKDSDRAEGQYKMKRQAGEMSAGFGYGRSGFGPGGGGTGWGTIGGAKPGSEPAAPPRTGRRASRARGSRRRSCSSRASSPTTAAPPTSRCASPIA
jgi:hypothetical protein